MEEKFNLLKYGFNRVFDTSVFGRIKEDIISIGESISYIFEDGAVYNSIDKWFNYTLLTLGKMIGAIATLVFELADGILGGLAKSLDENKDYIKEKLISIFDIKKETAILFGDLFSGLAEIFRSFGSDSFKSAVSEIFTGITVTSLGIAELGNKIGRELINYISKPISENAGEIRLALENIFKINSNSFSVLNDALKDTFESINKMYDTKLKPFIDKVTEVFSECLGNLLDGFNNDLMPVLENLSEKFSIMWKEHLQPLIDKIVEFAGVIIECVQQIWETYMAPFWQWLSENFFAGLAPLLDWLGTAVMAFIGYIADTISNIITVLEGVIEFLTGVFTGDWDKVWSGLYKILEGIIDQIITNFEYCWDGIKTIFSPVINWFSDIFGKAKKAIEEKWSDIKTWASNKWNDIKNAFLNAPSYFSEKFSDAKNKAIEKWNDVKSRFSGIWDGIKNVFSNIPNYFSEKFSEAKNNAVNKFNEITEKISGIMTNVKNAVSEGVSKLKNMFDFNWSLPKIKLPHFSVSGSFSLNPPSIPSFSVKS